MYTLVFILLNLYGCYAILNCRSLPAHVPANITDLRPGNVKVVMAMGDSITAAFGLNGASAGLVEVRGKSHCIGGDPNATTEALWGNIAEYCNNDICPPDQYRPAEDVLNSAQSGSTVQNLITHQLDYLLKVMQANPNINMQEDWKLLTLFIGGNDLCESCSGNAHDPEEFGDKLGLALEGIRMSIPRVFVQIVEIFNISQVYELSLKSTRCADIHRTLPFECDCVFKPNATATRQLVDVYSQQYNAQARALAAKYQSMAYPEFTVVAQPYGRNTALQDMPVAILSDLDCFHPSLMGHEAMAIALWYLYQTYVV